MQDSSTHRATPLAETLALVDLVHAGDDRAMESLLSRYLPRIKRIVALRMGRRLAEIVEHDDLVQETLQRVFEGVHRFECTSEGTFRGWVARLAEHAIVDAQRHHRAQKRDAARLVAFPDAALSTELIGVLPDDQPGPAEGAANREFEASIEAALLALAPHQRELLVLRHLCGMSYAEMARQLELDESTVRKACRRNEQKLRGMLEEGSA